MLCRYNRTQASSDQCIKYIGDILNPPEKLTRGLSLYCLLTQAKYTGIPPTIVIASHMAFIARVSLNQGMMNM